MGSVRNESGEGVAETEDGGKHWLRWRARTYLERAGSGKLECYQVCELMLLALSDVGQQTRLDLGWNCFSQ
ncbi:hypothetical protein Tco_0051445 [Tanacetum coccineum]